MKMEFSLPFLTVTKFCQASYYRVINRGFFPSLTKTVPLKNESRYPIGN